MGNYFDLAYLLQTFPIILSYVHTTLLITAVASIVGLALGSLIALTRIHRIAGFDACLTLYISFFRGTPFLVQLFLAYFGLPELLQKLGFEGVRDIPTLFYVFLIFSLHFAAYSAEIVRSAILAVDRGQMEAAHSIGMGTVSAYRRIVLPQAFTLALPAVCNQVISILKGTSLVFHVGIVDMMRKADFMGANSQRSLELYINVAVIYILLVLIISRLSDRLEKRAGWSVDA
ncbi:MAG: amino acid ABC transporter permease [Sporomusaceae bacterium]|nr:amino acid ABC transporter permease [Sporomusaceae bacterium]